MESEALDPPAVEDAGKDKKEIDEDSEGTKSKLTEPVSKPETEAVEPEAETEATGSTETPSSKKKKKKKKNKNKAEDKPEPAVETAGSGLSSSCFR